MLKFKWSLHDFRPFRKKQKNKKNKIMKNFEKEFEINYVFKRTFCNIGRSHAHTGETNAKASKIDADCACCICCPKVGGMFIELNVAFAVAINWWIISTPPRTALAKHLITKTSRPAINSVCLCLASGQWICLTAWPPDCLTDCLPAPQKTKNKIKEQQQQQKDQRVAEEERTAQFATLLGRPSLFCFEKRSAHCKKLHAHPYPYADDVGS